MMTSKWLLFITDHVAMICSEIGYRFNYIPYLEAAVRTGKIPSL